MTGKINLPIILGTGRKGRQSEKVARFIREQARDLDFDSPIIDVRNYTLPATDNSETSLPAKKLKGLIQQADGLVIVSPEYNHSFPGELKMMLDLLYKDWQGKPVGLAGVSGGNWGGTRGVEQLKLLVVNLKMMPLAELYFPQVASHPLDNAPEVKQFLKIVGQFKQS